MKIAIVNTVAGISSRELAEFLRKWTKHQVDVIRAQEASNDFRAYDLVINYGSGYNSLYNKIINTPYAVNRCIHKPTTFECMKKAKVDTVEYATRKDEIPKHWSWGVVRTDAAGRKAEGLDYFENVPGKIPDGQLYSEYFEHRYEYRVVVLMGKLVGVYYKRWNDGIHTFKIQPEKGFEKMVDHCLRAAKSIGIDYAGFDVVAQSKTNFKILEANSAPILTAEAMEAFYNLIEDK